MIGSPAWDRTRSSCFKDSRAAITPQGSGADVRTRTSYPEGTSFTDSLGSPSAASTGKIGGNEGSRTLIVRVQTGCSPVELRSHEYQGGGLPLPYVHPCGRSTGLEPASPPTLVQSPGIEPDPPRLQRGVLPSHPNCEYWLPPRESNPAFLVQNQTSYR